MKKRGIIMAPPVEVNGNTIIGGGVDLEQEIRMALFFWDKIILPNNNMFYMSYSNIDDVNLLQNEKILTIEEVWLTGSYSVNEDFFLNIQEEIFNNYNHKGTEYLWSLQQLHKDLSFKASKNIRKTLQRTIEFELYKAIPIPQRSIPIEEILNFKEKYNDELIMLRLCLSAMYDEIISSPDQIFTQNTKMLQLEKAICDLHKSMDSHKVMKNKCLVSHKIVLRADFSDLVGSISAAYGFYEEMNNLGVSQYFSAFLASVGAFIKIGIKRNEIIEDIPNELKDYAYISRIENEFA